MIRAAAERIIENPSRNEDAAEAVRAVVVLLVRDPEGTARRLSQLFPGRTVLPVRRDDLRGLSPRGVVSQLRSLRADEIVFLTDDLNAHEGIGRLMALGALPIAPRRELRDLRGRRLSLSSGRFLARDLPFLAAGLTAGGVALGRTLVRMHALLKAPRRRPRPAVVKRICCLRSDLWSGIPAGGSVAHTAGVVSGLRDQGCEVFLIASDRPAALDSDRHEVFVVPPRRLYAACPGIPALAHSLVFETGAGECLQHHPAGLLYQRYDPASHAGVILSRRFGLPFVLEYNGSEIWIADHWGRRPLRLRSLFQSIEAVNLRHADLISVVSTPLAEQLRARGIEAERIVVLPNGVDPGRYHPGVDGRAVRARYGLQGSSVVGFIGTFEAWHGAPVLARAAARLLAARRELRLLFVGDGPQRRQTEQILEAGGVAGRAVFTGFVPQEEGPEHLAAMDVLVAPHIPNADGSRFFGSPTKLFEYMAMGRGIVASRLEQLGEVLEDGVTALLTPPADETALAEGVARLIDDARLRARLGAQARRSAVERHTWEAHGRALLERLRRMELVSWS